MRKNRCIHEIIYDLLKNIAEHGNSSKTKICSYSNLPIDRCNKLLIILENNGLLTKIFEDNKEKYVLTANGYAYIGLYEQIRKILLIEFSEKKMFYSI